MSDFLLELSQNKAARNLIKRLGLPLPLPETLRRARGPWSERELDGRDVLVAAGPRPALLEAVAATLARDGAAVKLIGMELPVPPFARPAEAWSRPLETWGTIPDGARLDALVLDCSGLGGPDDLGVLHRVVGGALAALGRSCRVVVLARPDAAAATPAAAAASHALDGFVRSLGKELGRRGGTAQRVLVAPGAEARLPAVLRWLLSARSAWLTGQTVTVDGRVAQDADAEPTPRVLPLAGKTAVVTGAARGIGASIVKRFVAEGAHVVAVDRPGDEGPLSELCRAVGARPLSLDVTAADALAKLRALAAEADGIDIVIHNAGITRDKTLARMKPETWEQALAVNLAAVVRLTDGLVADGLADDARVVCLSSIAGLAGNFGQTNYATAKAGIIGYVGALAGQVAARGIAVNAMAPGFVETRLTAAIPAMTREIGRRMAALGQGGLPEDVAELAVLLASPGAVGITGQTLRICGGNFIGA